MRVINRLYIANNLLQMKVDKNSCFSRKDIMFSFVIVYIYIYICNCNK